MLQQTRAALPSRLTRFALRIKNPDRWQLAASRNDSTDRLSFSAHGGGGGEPAPPTRWAPYPVARREAVSGPGPPNKGEQPWQSRPVKSRLEQNSAEQLSTEQSRAAMSRLTQQEQSKTAQVEQIRTEQNRAEQINT